MIIDAFAAKIAREAVKISRFTEQSFPDLFASSGIEKLIIGKILVGNLLCQKLSTSSTAALEATAGSLPE